VELPQKFTQANEHYFAHTRPHIVEARKQFSDDYVKMLISNQLFMVFHNRANAVD
jgi:hypothetical protein